MRGEPETRPVPIFFEHEGNRAARDGQWKLVAKGEQGPWELYDMTTDRAETHDLANEHPEKVKELRARLAAFAKQAVPPKSRPKPKGFVTPKVWGETE